MVFHLHRWETPLYNKALEHREVIKKCQCGTVKTVKRYIPMPDTEEYEAWKNGQEDATNIDDSSILDKVLPIISLIVGMIIMVVVILPLMQTVISCVSPGMHGPSGFLNATCQVIDVDVLCEMCKGFGYLLAPYEIIGSVVLPRKEEQCTKCRGQGYVFGSCDTTRTS